MSNGQGNHIQRAIKSPLRAESEERVATGADSGLQNRNLEISAYREGTVAGASVGNAVNYPRRTATARGRRKLIRQAEFVAAFQRYTADNVDKAEFVFKKSQRRCVGKTDYRRTRRNRKGQAKKVAPPGVIPTAASVTTLTVNASGPSPKLAKSAVPSARISILTSVDEMGRRKSIAVSSELGITSSV